MRFTKRLKVSRVVEEFHVPSMGDDVVYFLRRYRFAFLQAVYAKWVTQEVMLSYSTPMPVVQTR